MSISTKSSRWESLLPSFSLNRRITVLVLLATMVVVGLVSFSGIPLELMPRGFTPNFLGVFVPWQDAPPQEVLEKIVLPLEEELATVRGLDNLASVAFTGGTRVFLIFKQGTDMDVAYRETRDRLQRARVRLPSDADRLLIEKHDPADFPVSGVGLIIDPELTAAYDLIENEVKLPLSRIDGVANVEVNGLEEREILIELDRERTESAGLNIFDLARSLGDDNFSLASGNVRSGDRKLLLRSVARFGSLEALENRRITNSVRLKDIATIKYEEPDKDYRVRVNSKPAVALMLFKEGDANTLEVSRAIKAEIEKMENNPRLAGTEMKMLFDQGDVILESLGTLLDSGKIGGLFAIAVLFFFLRRLRMTLIITLSIPLSLLIALTAMYFTGETLNILTLLGLMICVGLLVDNSVVVAENIYRLHRQGMPRREAAVKGAGEIALAIVMATLTTITVFLPISLVDGDMQFFLQRLSIPISVSLVASLLVALVFVPLSTYLTLTDNGNGGGGVVTRTHQRLNEVLRRIYERTMGTLNRAYTRLLAVFLRRGRWLDLAFIFILLFGVSIGLVQADKVRIGLADEEERAGFEIDVEMPRSTALEESTAFFDEIEDILEVRQAELDLEGYFFWHDENDGEIQGWFNNPRTTKMTPRQAMEKLLEYLPEKPGTEYFTGNERQAAEDTKSEEVIGLFGEDAKQLETVAQELEDIFETVEGVVGVQRSADPAPNELALILDRDRLQRQQVNPTAVASVVGYALRGQALPKFYSDGREIPVRIRFEEEDRESLAELNDFQVPTATGELVSLSSLTTVQMQESAQAIRRRNKRQARTITLELAEGKEEDTRDRLAALSKQIDLPEGITFGAGIGRAVQDEGKAMMLALMLSILFIYLLMAFLFESFILPLSIVLTIPLAFIGVVGIHLVFGKQMDMLGVVGMVLLVGVVVNNGIVLIDYINRLRREGMDRTKAVLTAADHRFRPIMMTALTTICGMVPLTIGGATSIGISYKSFGFTLIGGLSTATLLTLLVVPVAYTVFDDVREGATRTLRRAWLGGRSEEAPAEAG